MKDLGIILLFMLISTVTCSGQDQKSNYNGKYCKGEGDVKFLRLIDESFAFFHPNPTVPNISMLYEPNWNTLVESGGWSAWWIQNSYGFSYSVSPFLQEPWVSILQRSWDMFWNNQGDGKRMGRPYSKDDSDGGPLMRLVAPDGSLGDADFPTEII